MPTIITPVIAERRRFTLVVDWLPIARLAFLPCMLSLLLTSAYPVFAEAVNIVDEIF